MDVGAQGVVDHPPAAYSTLSLLEEGVPAIPRLRLVDVLAIFLAFLVTVPLWILWVPLSLPLYVIGLLAMALLQCRTSSRVARIDRMKPSFNLPQGWGSMHAQLFQEEENVESSECWLIMPVVWALLPFIAVDCGLATRYPAYLAVKAERARRHHESALFAEKLIGSWSLWVWHSLFLFLLVANKSSRAATYRAEQVAQGGGLYWWHGQGVFTGSHSTVDRITRANQHRCTRRAAFQAVVPHAFPKRLLIFLPNPDDTSCEWAEIRRVLHQTWLEESGAEYKERTSLLDAKIRDCWTAPSLEGMADEKISTLVAKCMFFVVFGIWPDDADAQILADWRNISAYFVMPRFLHRVAFNAMLFPLMRLRAETVGLIHKHHLEHIFQKMNARLSAKVQRCSDVQLCDELMFAICFAGVGGTSAGTVSVGKFLLAHVSEDCSSPVDFGGRTRAEMVSLFKDFPQRFIQETCRISAPVGTVTEVLTKPTDLGLASDGPVPAGTAVSGVVNMSNLDPTVFPDPMKFDLFRPNLDDALTWNGKAFGADEAKYPRICPGRYLAIEIISAIAHAAIGDSRPTALESVGSEKLASRLKCSKCAG